MPYADFVNSFITHVVGLLGWKVTLSKSLHSYRKAPKKIHRGLNLDVTGSSDTLICATTDIPHNFTHAFPLHKE
jgi:hypothetical protein